MSRTINISSYVLLCTNRQSFEYIRETTYTYDGNLNCFFYLLLYFNVFQGFINGIGVFRAIKFIHNRYDYLALLFLDSVTLYNSWKHNVQLTKFNLYIYTK